MGPISEYSMEMRICIFIFGIISGFSMPKSWNKRYGDFMRQFEGKGQPMGWWVENSKFPLHEDMSRANFAKMEKKAVQTRQNPTWGEVVDSISTLPKVENILENEVVQDTQDFLDKYVEIGPSGTLENINNCEKKFQNNFFE